VSNFNFSGVTAENIVATEQVDACIPVRGVVTNVGTTARRADIPIKGMSTPRLWNIIGSGVSRASTNTGFSVQSEDTHYPTSYSIASINLGDVGVEFNYTVTIVPFYYFSVIDRRGAHIFLDVKVNGSSVARSVFATDTANNYINNQIFSVTNMAISGSLPTSSSPSRHIIY
jgi:hypothetical protein